MAKFNSKLSGAEIEEIFYKLCHAISETKNAQDAASFLRDILSLQEAEMIAKRLKIAELLLDGDTYEDINRKIKASFATIARVQEWLKISGDGYRQAVKNTKNKNIKKDKECPTISSLSIIKKKYPMYYWPEAVLESIVKNADYKQKRELRAIIGQMHKMKEKTALYRRLRRMLR